MNSMYNTLFMCTYHFYDASLVKMNPVSKMIVDVSPIIHEESEDELLEMAVIVYKTELLAFFGLNEYDDKKVNDMIEGLYKKIFAELSNDNGKSILMKMVEKLSAHLLSDDLMSGFILLFSYSYFHLTHLCLCDFLNDGKMNEMHINALNGAINFE